jgi:hypothetical protein
MSRRIGSLDEEPSEKLEDYSLYFAHNVRSIEAIFDNEEKFGWMVKEDNKDVEHIPFYYLYIDGKPDDPFGHWVFECGIYLPLFFLLKKKYSSLRIFSKNPKKYKEIFYNAFGIEGREISSDLESNNTVIFTQWNSLGDHSFPRRNEFLKHAQSFYNHLVPQGANLQKPIDILYLPRGTKENFKSNDRHIPAQDILLSRIQSYFPSTIVYDTDNTTNICDQINLVRSSKIILMDYGSSLLVNGFFAEDSIIIVLGDFGHIHCKNPKPYLLLQESLKRGCRYIYLPMHCPAELILHFIAESLVKGFEIYTHKYNCWKLFEGHTCEECTSYPL